MRSRKHTLLIVLSSTEPNLQQFQSQRSEYNNSVANKKADMAQKQLNMIQVQLVYSLNNSKHKAQTSLSNSDSSPISIQPKQ